MSSFDDRVQRAISATVAAAMRDHLQYHLDSQQDEPRTSMPEHMEECCENIKKILNSTTNNFILIQDLEQGIREIRDYTRALPPPELGSEDPHYDPTTGSGSNGDRERNPWRNWLLPIVKEVISIWADLPSPGEFKPSDGEPLIPYVLALGKQLDDLRQQMAECCGNMNRKLDEILNRLPPAPTPPETVTSMDDDEDDENVPLDDCTSYEVHMRPCNDVLESLRVMDPDAAIAFLQQSNQYDYTIDVSTSADNYETETTTYTPIDLNDTYVHMQDGEILYIELVKRSQAQYVETLHLQGESLTTHTWIKVTPRNPHCGNPIELHYVEVTDQHLRELYGIQDKPAIIVEDLNSTTTDVTVHTISVTKQPEVYTIPAPPKDKEEGMIVNPAIADFKTDYVEQGKYNTETQTTPNSVIFSPETLDNSSDPATQQSLTGEGHSRIKIIAGSESDNGYNVWNMGDQFKRETLTGAKVGDEITKDQLIALGFTNVDGRSAVITEIKVYDGKTHPDVVARNQRRNSTGEVEAVYGGDMCVAWTDTAGSRGPDGSQPTINVATTPTEIEGTISNPFSGIVPIALPTSMTTE